MHAEIVCIGTEITQGEIVNSNASYLSKKLAQLGIDVCYHTTVDDDSVRLYTALKRAMHRSDIVITTGGLGPTVDDITLGIIGQATQKKMILNPQILRNIKDHFHQRHIAMPKDNVRMALVPEGARPLKNEVGTAPGLIMPNESKVLVALPGVPAEMRAMMERDVIAYLAKHFPAQKAIVSRTIRTTGLAESQVNQRVKDILKLEPPTTVGIYVHTHCVDLTITARAKSKLQAKKLIAAVEKKIRSRLKAYIYGQDQQTLEQTVAQALIKKKKTIAVAESCTGGLISKRLTSIGGSSRYFPLGLVAYSNQTKKSLLGLSEQTLKDHGAVSPQVAQALAQNVQQLAKADLGLGVTGIAGPSGGTKEKPVGLVYIALATPRKIQCQEFLFHGDRSAVRLRASQAALDMLRQYLT
ncbi:MAG: competence/damage-inducible protein A [Candidatus Omnitrophica bacterium]|nr:competence/damage-inducible protein A [Candidatus Omnitrophota bacterium]